VFSPFYLLCFYDRLALLQIPGPVVVLNWLALIALLWLSYLGFAIFALLLTMNRNGTKKAAMLMARQAYIIEMSARMQEVRSQVYTFSYCRPPDPDQ
jgi:hypothetical protein